MASMNRRQRANERLNDAGRKLKEISEQIKKSRAKKNGAEGHRHIYDFEKVAPLQNGSSLDATQRCEMRRTLRGHFGKVYALHWGQKDVNMPDGISQNLISASQDGKLIVWNAYTKAKLHAIPLRSTWVMTCAFEPTKGRMVACGGLDNVCSVYRLSGTGGVMQDASATELTGHEGYLACCRFVNDSKILTCSGDATCNFWDIGKNKLIQSFSDHTGDVMSVSLNPANSNIFVSGSCDAAAKVWDIREGGCVMSFDANTLGGNDDEYGGSNKGPNAFAHSSDINSVDYLPSGKQFATGSDDSTARIFDVRSYSQLNMFWDRQHRACLTSVAASKNGRLLFCGYDDAECHAWDTLLKNNQWAKLTGHNARVSCVGLDPTGKALATGSWDTLIRIFA